MLGIAFTGGEGPGPEKARWLLAAAGEGSAAGRGRAGSPGPCLVAAADSGLAAAVAAGIRPDFVIGDMDSLKDLSLLDSYPADRVIRCKPDKDYTDTEMALSLLWEKGCDEIWLLGGGGGRTDHLFAIRSLFERDRFPSRWFTAAEDIFCVEAPGGLVYPDAGAASLEGGRKSGGLVSVFPLGSGPWEASGRGLKWPLEGLDWNRGFFGVSNVAPDGDFSIRALRGRFLIILPLR
ncbi:MAG: thiamine diphosphokinase [Treponema sp.]|nr:thiamine diphosphokinase [Treponema sp.]